MARKISILFILLILIQSASAGFLVRESMYEGQSKVYLLEEGYYNLTVVSVSEARRKAVFDINGMRTKALGRDDRDYLEDGSRIIMRNVIGDEDGKDYVEFYFSGSGKGLLPLSMLGEEREDMAKNLGDKDNLEIVEETDNPARKLFEYLANWMASLFRKV